MTCVRFCDWRRGIKPTIPTFERRQRKKPKESRFSLKPRWRVLRLSSGAPAPSRATGTEQIPVSKVRQYPTVSYVIPGKLAASGASAAAASVSPFKVAKRKAVAK